MKVPSGQRVRNLSAVFMLEIEDMNVPGQWEYKQILWNQKNTVFTEKNIDFLK